MKEYIFLILSLIMIVFVIIYVNFSENNYSSSMNKIEDDLFLVTLKDTTKIDSILVIKHLREMHIFGENKLIKKYKIGLGFTPIGKKHFEGDGKTPEGLYLIDGKNLKSDYYKNLGISYPNEDDLAYATSFDKSPGGLIKIHGFPNGENSPEPGVKINDWTFGCIAIANESIDELYQIIEINTPINILP